MLPLPPTELPVHELLDGELMQLFNSLRTSGILPLAPTELPVQVLLVGELMQFFMSVISSHKL